MARAIQPLISQVLFYPLSEFDGTMKTNTFATGQVPPVKGFWSLTLYNAEHFFHPNLLKRCSLGTKNKNLKYNADGSLTLDAQRQITWQGQGK